MILDNDKKFPNAFDAVFEFKGINIIRIPYRAPNANPFAERWVRSVRQELLDHVLVLNRAHLRRILQTYIDHYNTRRPQQSLAQQSPIPYPMAPNTGTVAAITQWARKITTMP